MLHRREGGGVSEFENLKRQTLSDSVYERLREAILGGDIAPGDELNQVSLARQFDVSRVPVREALRRLQAEQLVTATPYQQYIVSAVTPRALLELLDLREELEVFAVTRHMQNFGEELERQAKALNAELKKIDDGTEWLARDVELHSLFDGPGTEVSRIVLELRGRVHRYLRTVASTSKRRRQACSEHDRIIAAMVAKDPKAAEQALREHVEHTRRVIRSWLEDRGELHEAGVASADGASAREA